MRIVEMCLVIPRHALIASELELPAGGQLRLIKNPAEFFVCGVNTAVMALDAEL
jgi:hypothetical protein